MDRIQGKAVLVTGASAGIGEACARAFAARGARVVLLARREDRLRRLAEALRREHGTEVRTLPLDVRDRPAVTAAATSLRDGWAPDILVNNAGLGRGLDRVHQARAEDWDEMIETNLTGLLNVTRAVLPSMVERDRGHVINVGSVAGHWVYPRNAVYCATKHAVRALTEGINVDLAGTRVRVSSVDPGLVETEFSRVRFRGDNDRARAVYDGYRPLAGEDVADAVCWVASLPEHVNVFDLVIMPTAQRNPYVLHREEG